MVAEAFYKTNPLVVYRVDTHLEDFSDFFLSLTHRKFHTWQLAFGDAVYLVDAVAGGHALIQACKLGLESPYVTKVCHDCKRDSEVPFTSYLYLPVSVLQHVIGGFSLSCTITESRYCIGMLRSELKWQVSVKNFGCIAGLVFPVQYQAEQCL